MDCEREAGATDRISKLKCSVCTRFQTKIERNRNFSDKWIVGADSLLTSNIKDHAKSAMHKHAMLLLQKEQAKSKGQGPSAYAPIAKMLNDLPEQSLSKLRIKFDLAYFVATEKLAFTKYPALCELEAHHGVIVGTEYTNEYAAKTFCHYIAETGREKLAENIATTKFF